MKSLRFHFFWSCSTSIVAMLNLKRTTVTIDAIWCQKEIAAKIVEGGGSYAR
jgi:predicted transposase YbfD/YdcC